MCRHPRSKRVAIAGIGVVSLLLTACGGERGEVASAAPVTTTTTPVETSPTTVRSTTVTVRPTPTTRPTAPPSKPVATVSTPSRRSLSPLPLDPTGFGSSIGVLDDVVTARIVGSSWNADCPFPLDELRYVQVTHHTTDGGRAIGELVVAEDLAEDVVEIFAALFEAGFPIESMRLVDDFDGDDLRSMQANNTSAFNCRFVAGTTNWSWHTFGRAIDINPLVNPYVTGEGVDPPEGAVFADRTRHVKGMIHPGDAVTAAFDRFGWTWGGDWATAKDYQHFDRADD